MTQRPTIREQIDACRPDSDDLHLPEHAPDLVELQASLRESGDVRRQWEQSQAESRLIRGAMQDILLPAGLEDRLLAAVQTAEVDSTTAPHPTSRHQPNRRRFIQVASSLAAAAAVVLVGVFVYRQLTETEQPITKEQLVSRAESWLRSADQQTMKPATTIQAAPGGFVLGKVVRSKTFSAGSDRITAYAVQLGGSTAILLEIPTNQVYPVNSLPYSTLGVSGGWTVGVWQRDGVLYVIAVPDGGSLPQFVRQQPVG